MRPDKPLFKPGERVQWLTAITCEWCRGEVVRERDDFGRGYLRAYDVLVDGHEKTWTIYETLLMREPAAPGA